MELTRQDGQGWIYTGVKTPDEKPRVPLPAASWLVAGDSVTGCTLTTTPAGISTTIDTSTANAPTITIWGGAHGQRYELPILITTNAGLKIQITIFVDVKNHTRRTS